MKNIVKEDKKIQSFVYSRRNVKNNWSTFVDNLIRTFKSNLSTFVDNKSVIYSHLINILHVY